MIRIVVFAYHSVGCSCLEALLRFEDEISLVVTHKDAPEEEIWFDSVARLAQSRPLPLAFAEDMDEDGLAARLETLQPDLIYSFYYRRLLPERILRIPRLGAFNVHGSMLPRYRGRCPVNWVLVHGEETTGVTLHAMVKKADAGDIVAQKGIAIDPRETALSLYRKMIPLAGRLIEENHPLLREGRGPRIPQDPAKVSIVPGRRPADGRVDWSLPAVRIDGLVRAVTRPYPGAFAYWRGRKMFIWESYPEKGNGSGSPGLVQSLEPFLVRTGEGVLRVVTADLDDGRALVRDGRPALPNLEKGDLLA